MIGKSSTIPQFVLKYGHAQPESTYLVHAVKMAQRCDVINHLLLAVMVLFLCMNSSVALPHTSQAGAAQPSPFKFVDFQHRVAEAQNELLKDLLRPGKQIFGHQASTIL